MKHTSLSPLLLGEGQRKAWQNAILNVLVRKRRCCSAKFGPRDGLGCCNLPGGERVRELGRHGSVLTCENESIRERERQGKRGRERVLWLSTDVKKDGERERKRGRGIERERVVEV